MSCPVVLVINSDSCRHCVPLMEKQFQINKAIKEKYPSMACSLTSLRDV